MARVTLEYRKGRWCITALPRPERGGERLPLALGECGSRAVAMHLWLALTASEAGD